jgi:signal transduction histidine kinase
MAQDTANSNFAGSASPANLARVLVADDDEAMCTICVRALESAGYAPTAVMDGTTALTTLRANGPFDLLLADIQMPETSGLDLARIAREIDPAIAVVIMTGHTSLDTLHASVRRGVADYLSKPFELAELIVVVEQALHKRHLLQESLRLRAVEQLLRSSEAINAILDRDQLADTIIARALEHVPTQAGFLIVASSGNLPTRVVCAPPEAELLGGGRDAVAQSLRSGRAVAITSEQPLARLSAQQFKSGLAVPLRAQGEAVGALLLCDDHADLASPSTQELLSLLANQAGNALRNAHLYSELDAAYKGLRELDRLKSEFIAIASHELRSPLAIVLGYARMVRDRSEGETRDFSQRVLDGADNIKQIVDDLMRLRDFDRKQITLHVEPGRLDELVQQIIERFSPSAQQKGQILSAELPDAAIWLNFDREKACLVLANLTGNAIKFTPSGGQIVIAAEYWPHTQLAAALSQAPSNPTVRRLSGNLPANWAVIRIRDSGIGIARDQQQRIFDRFYQVASSLTREQGGTGLGLAIACDLAVIQGAVIWVDSVEGHGSTFSLALPAD